jgi:Domain of unknown function (DUF397)
MPVSRFTEGGLEMRSVDLHNQSWRKSSFSAADENCIEVGELDGFIGVRDSKDVSQPSLSFTSAQWQAFVGGIKRNEQRRA